MTVQSAKPAMIKLIAIDPPFDVTNRVLFGLQSRGSVEDPLPAHQTTTFEFQIELVIAGGAVADFKGEYVHGKKGDRFVYLSWGFPDGGEPFTMFARAKVKLSDIPQQLLNSVLGDGGQLVCRLEATNGKGQPASGTIKPPALEWSWTRPA